MAKKQFLLGFVSVIMLLAACAPEAAATNPSAAATELPGEVAPAATLAAPTLEPATQAAPAEESTVLPVATSRGPDLHATDPTTVRLASGGLQFVEFFRFT
jgi:hypothetical protein